jgi:hypothetical protein
MPDIIGTNRLMSFYIQWVTDSGYTPITPQEKMAIEGFIYWAKAQGYEL